MSLQAQLAAAHARLVSAINAVNAKISSSGSGATTKLAADFVNATVAFTDVTGMTYTPPANTDFEMEFWLLVVAGAAATNLPRVGISIGAGQQYGAASVEQCGATLTTEVVQHGTFLAAAVNVQVPAGGFAAISTPYEAVGRVKGRSGAAPGAIKLQLAAETAAANAAIVKAGSRMTVKTL